MADVYQVPAAERQERIEKYLDIFEIKDAVNVRSDRSLME